MRHKKRKGKLNRTTAHRKALLKNLVKSLMYYETIKTTLKKAKQVEKLADKVINLARVNNLKNKRAVYSILEDHSLVSKVFSEIAPRFKDRKGGYTRIVVLGNREGDGAQMAQVSLVELRAKTQVKPKVEKKVHKKEIEAGQSQQEKKEGETKVKKEMLKEQKPPEREPKKKGFLGGLRKYLRKSKTS